MDKPLGWKDGAVNSVFPASALHVVVYVWPLAVAKPFKLYMGSKPWSHLALEGEGQGWWLT